MNIAKVLPANSLLEVIMELVAIQIIVFGTIILVYMAEEFNK
jgi:hypothetical protein